MGFNRKSVLSAKSADDELFESAGAGDLAAAGQKTTMTEIAEGLPG